MMSRAFGFVLASGVLAVVGLASIWAASARASTPLNATPRKVQPQSSFRLTTKDISGKIVSIPAPGAKATVVALTSTTCPLCLRYGPTLASLEKQYAKSGVQFVFVNPTEEPLADMQSMRSRLGWKGAYVLDPESVVTRQMGSKTTTEAYVLDAQGVVQYRGAVDDQYAIGASLPEPRKRFLASALDSVLKGAKPAITFTEAPGCLLNVEAAAPQVAVTYHGQIRSFIDKNCLQCHRPGGVGPFTLDSYASVKSRGKMLQYVMKEGIMPPWFADHPKDKSPWINDRQLAPQDKAMFDAWVEAGMPEGKPDPKYVAPKFVEGWTIGKPDSILQIPNPIAVKATGTMPYQNVVVPTGFTEDKWVTAIEVMPTDLSVVHHVLVFVGDRSRRQLGEISDDELDEISGFFGIYVPGNSALVYSNGLAKRIPKGANLRFQIHYTPNGKETQDQTRIGFKFATEPPKQEVHTASLVNLQFVIPAQAPNHEVTAQMRIPSEVKILSFLPHMHVRGKAARYELTPSGGQQTTLLNVPKYNFNWQLNYIFKEPLSLKKGDNLKYTAWYDNSENNPANPDPNRRVGWGLQTSDEMHLGYLEYIVPGEKPGTTNGVLRNRGVAIGNQSFITSTFKRLDRNSDGFVTEEEARLLWNRIKDADANGDGKISLEEAKEHFGG